MCSKSSDTIKIITDLSIYQKHEVSIRFIPMSMNRLHVILANAENVEIYVIYKNKDLIDLIVKELNIINYSIGENTEFINFRTIYRDAVNYFLVERF